MKRRTLSLFAVFALTLTGQPDEGQWLPQQVLSMDWDALKARGLELSKDQFWHPERGGVLTAAVQIGGCSASFVSPEGLVVTNHHCGYSAIQRLSTVEQNYLRDGFVAEDRAAELPAPGMVVYVVRRIENVTEKVHAAQAKAKTDLERWQITEKTIQQLVAKGEEEPNTKCHVASFLEGQEYHLYYRTRITDVRLVYAPPSSVGEFGGEVDNWEWPRHTGDFTFFRAYAAPDGTSRPYSEDNVPYRPEHYLRVSGEGVHEGDLVMILGYPGRTERYLTSAAVQDRQGFVFPMRHRLYSGIIDVLQRASEGDERRALQFASVLKSLSNVQKNALGMIKGLARNGVVARKLQEEAAFEAWVAKSSRRRKAHGDALSDALALDLAARETIQKEQVLSLLGGGLNPLLSTLAGAVSEANSSGELSERTARRLAADNLLRDFDDVQLPILEGLLDEARALPEDQRIAGTEAFTAADPDTPTSEILREAVASSAAMDSRRRADLFRDADTIANSTDPLVILARGLAAELQARAQRRDERRGRQLLVGQRWIEAQQEWRGKTFYPDANSTLRVSIASVKSYAPRDGVVNVPHTTVGGVLAKETGVAPFNSPAPLLEVAGQRAQSRFFDPEIGDVPVCFLSDGDTTGGNSGSPVINGKGELVGLNFDRVFENVAGDYGWLTERSRNISVDIRYALWIMDQVMPAPNLLKELGV